jgi:hypothetical protein
MRRTEAEAEATLAILRDVIRNDPGLLGEGHGLIAPREKGVLIWRAEPSEPSEDPGGFVFVRGCAKVAEFYPGQQCVVLVPPRQNYEVLRVTPDHRWERIKARFYGWEIQFPEWWGQ